VNGNRSSGERAARKGERRLRRERRTLVLMTELYCSARHNSAGALCVQCRQLLEYALERVERCPHGARKPACSACTVHCYQPDMAEAIRGVMRYSGPRMVLRHPVLALRHLVERSVWKRFTSLKT